MDDVGIDGTVVQVWRRRLAGSGAPQTVGCRATDREGRCVSLGCGGAALKVPKGALPAGGQAQLAVFEPQGELHDALSAAYEFETSFYAVSAQGATTGWGGLPCVCLQPLPNHGSWLFSMSGSS